MKTGLLYAILFCFGAGGFVAWRVHAVRNREMPHFEIVRDPSASHWDGCESMIGLAEQVLRTKGAASGSTLTVLVLGDQSTANEPWRMGAYPIPVVRRVLEGRSERLRYDQEILGDISRKCRDLHRTTVSPIFLGVTQAVADLHAHDCKTTSHCQLFVDSDLEENVEASIRKRFYKKDGWKRSSLPQIGNAGIDIVFCGVAVTDGRVHGLSGKETGRGITRDSGRLEQVWRSLFAEPARVTFEPYCPNSTRPGLQLESRASLHETPQP